MIFSILFSCLFYETNGRKHAIDACRHGYDGETAFFLVYGRFRSACNKGGNLFNHCICGLLFFLFRDCHGRPTRFARLFILIQAGE